MYAVCCKFSAISLASPPLVTDAVSKIYGAHTIIRCFKFNMLGWKISLATLEKG